MSEMRWQVVPEPGGEIIDAWDRLAVELGRPYCAPGWMLGWGVPDDPGAEVRVGVVREDGGVIGILPLGARAGANGASAVYELLGSRVGYRIEPLAAPGKREAVASAGAALLGTLDPALGVLSLEGIDPEAGWADALAGAFPGGARVDRGGKLYAPALELGGAATYEDWLHSRGRHFRKRAAADRRRFLAKGRLEIAATAAELDLAVDAFVGLHLARWRGRGESNLDFSRMGTLLRAAATRLGPERLRASLALVGDEVISVDLFVHAGGVAASWNGGWLDAHRDLRPGWQTLSAGIEDAIERGVPEIDLGPGAHPWKRRLATRDGTVVTDRVVPRVAAGASAGSRG